MTLFCAVYPISSSGWAQAAIISLCLDWLAFGLAIPISLGFTRMLAKRWPILCYILIVQTYICRFIGAMLG